MSSQGTSTSIEENWMMFTETVKLTTCSQTYDKPIEKKDKGASSKKYPYTNSSPPPASNVPLTIEKPKLNLILLPPKTTIWKYVFNPSARAAQFYNVVEDLAQAPCAMSTLKVLQSFPMQCKDLDNTSTIHFNVENYKSMLSH